MVACPEKQELSSYALGGLSGERAEQLDAHVVQCGQCAQTLFEVVSQNDSGGWGPQDTEVASDDIATLVQQIQEFRHRETVDVERRAERFDSRLDTLVADTMHPPSGSTRRSVHTYFLSPPQQEGEMGRLAHYRICEVLGSGGMGVVFRAHDTRLDRWVALKVLKPSLTSEEAKHRFRREARAAASIEHEHVVSIYEVAELEELSFLAMQLLRGESLHDRLDRRGACTHEEILRIGREIAEGLSAAHQKQLIHRDIKPDNIWLEADGDRVKILDFGLARINDDSNLTQTGSVLGTPRYMSPEQAKGESIDQRSDLFSLGCVLYHMAIGQPTFKASSVSATLLAVIQEDPAPPYEIEPAVGEPLSQLILQLLEKAPENRPSSAEEVVHRLRELENTGATSAARFSAARPPSNRSHGGARFSLPVGKIVGVAVLLALAIPAVFFGRHWIDPAHHTAHNLAPVAPEPERETEKPSIAPPALAPSRRLVSDFPITNVQAAIQKITDKIVAAMQEHGEEEIAMGAIDPSNDNMILRELLRKTLRKASVTDADGDSISIAIDSFAGWRVTGEFNFPLINNRQVLLLSFELKDENGRQISHYLEAVAAEAVEQ